MEGLFFILGHKEAPRPFRQGTIARCSRVIEASDFNSPHGFVGYIPHDVVAWTRLKECVLVAEETSI